ncbi:MAG: molybdopterin synthase sulfur carrier subunit [Opitutus sp.]|nr:molybdopterin synthase sulfur carrier subunit [Opitutus sp.]
MIPSVARCGIEVRFFAMLREQAGCSSTTVATTAANAAALYAELQQRHGLTFPVALLRVAINDRYAHLTDALSDGDRVVFIPPVAGG